MSKLIWGCLTAWHLAVGNWDIVPKLVRAGHEPRPCFVNESINSGLRSQNPPSPPLALPPHSPSSSCEGRTLRKTPGLNLEPIIKVRRIKRISPRRTLQDSGKNRLGSWQNWGNEGGDLGGWGPRRFSPVGQTGTDAVLYRPDPRTNFGTITQLATASRRTTKASRTNFVQKDHETKKTAQGEVGAGQVKAASLRLRSGRRTRRTPYYPSPPSRLRFATP